MKVKNILIIIVLVCLHSSLKAQIEERDSFKNRTFKERLTFNVGGGILFGTITNVNILPQIGYRITPRLTTGIGGNFQYFRDNNPLSPIDFMIYGGNAFTRYTVDPCLFLQGEYQKLYYNNSSGDYVMVGGGFMPGAGFFISAYYILYSPPNSIYGNNFWGHPIILRGGFLF